MVWAGIYVRISRDRVGAGLGVGRQRDDCHQLAERLGWEVSAVYEDNDLSAYSGKPRPGYRALLNDMEAGRIGGVLAWHTDRLHRSPVELEHYIDIAERHGVLTHTVTGGEVDLCTPSGRQVARLLGASARYESEHRSEQVRNAREEIAARGGFLGSVRPFGYTSDGMSLVPEESGAIIGATADILRGRSLRAVTADWNGRKLLTTKANNAWTSDAVRDVLTRPRNAGLLEHRGKIVGPAAWPALVSEDQWRGVRALLSDPARRTSPGNQPRWLGSGLFLCGVCQSPMTVGTSGQHRNPSYKCRTQAVRSEPHVTRQAKTLDDWVGVVLVERLLRPDAVSIFELETPVEADHETLRIELAAITTNRNAFAQALGEGSMTWEQFTTANDAARERQDTIEQELARLTQASHPGAEVAKASDPHSTWDDFELEQKRSILKLLATIVVHKGRPGRKAGGGYFDPSTVEVRWSNPPRSSGP